ncbi:MAG TPA: hypothetical protein VFS13_14765 [Steroidobacteraceae bacterium]|jgi:hypothetical protein|nr:hypothetical protein [Steroidobacteraceae bacterium]
MSDTKKDAPPDEDLLEFLGGIDEINEDTKGADGDLSDFLARADVDPVADAAKKSKSPPKEAKHE